MVCSHQAQRAVPGSCRPFSSYRWRHGPCVSTTPSRIHKVGLAYPSPPVSSPLRPCSVDRATYFRSCAEAALVHVKGTPKGPRWLRKATVFGGILLPHMALRAAPTTVAAWPSEFPTNGLIFVSPALHLLAQPRPQLGRGEARFRSSPLSVLWARRAVSGAAIG